MRFLAATSAFALLAGNAFAQNVVDDDPNLIRVDDITGGNIYTMNAPADAQAWGPDTFYERVGEGWQDVGEIEDVILDRRGNLVGIVAEIGGGFLGLGERDVLLPVEDIRILSDEDGREFSYVTRYTEEQLEALPEVDRAFWDD